MVYHYPSDYGDHKDCDCGNVIILNLSGDLTKPHV